MIKSKDYDIRYTVLEDEPALLQWMKDPSVLYWFPMSEGSEVEMSVKNWIAYCRYKASLTATWKGKPCGMGTLFLMPYQKIAHHGTFYVVVDPAYQRKGIGTSLVKNILHLAKTQFRLESVHVEIFEGCSLSFVLEKFSFKSFAYQKNFIKQSDGTYLARNLLEHFF